MITLILGRKGSGKTKRLVDMCNTAAKQSKGNVLFIEKTHSLTYNVSSKARLVVADEYGIRGFEALYGFISGMCAGNYDLTDIYVDSTLKIVGDDLEVFADFVEKLSKLSERSNTHMVLSVSANKEDLPERIAEYAKEV